MLSFLFGQGWWTLWYLFMWFWLLPAAFVFHYFTYFVPGAGPQGGEAIFALMLFIWIGFLIIFPVNAVLWAHGAPHSFAYRWLRMPVLALLAWGAMVTMVLVGADYAGKILGQEALGQVANVTMFAVYVVAILGNCWLLWDFRRG
jgi:hypothetical protein